MLKTGKFRLNSRRRLSAARGVMRCESHSPTTRPWGTSVPETPPHTQPFIPFFSKDNSLKLLNYRTCPQTLLKLDCSEDNKLSFCTGNPWIQRDSVRGSFPLLLQLLHRDQSPGLQVPVSTTALSPTSEQRLSEFLKLISCPCTFPPHTADFEPF